MELIWVKPETKYICKRGWTGILAKHEVICPSGTPRKRGIQYAAAFPFYHRLLWNTGSPACAGDDGKEGGAFP